MKEKKKFRPRCLDENAAGAHGSRVGGSASGISLFLEVAEGARSHGRAFTVTRDGKIHLVEKKWGFRSVATLPQDSGFKVALLSSFQVWVFWVLGLKRGSSDCGGFAI